MKEYLYEALDEDEIRLLELQHGDEDAELHGSLHRFRLPIEEELPDEADIVLSQEIHASVPNAPPYNALSYVWGEAVKPRHQIRLVQDGQPCQLSIKPNLYEALSRLRKEIPSGKSQMLWVDAISMNQVGVLNGPSAKLSLMNLPRMTFRRRTHRSRKWP